MDSIFTKNFDFKDALVVGMKDTDLFSAESRLIEAGNYSKQNLTTLVEAFQPTIQSFDSTVYNAPYSSSRVNSSSLDLELLESGGVGAFKANEWPSSRYIVDAGVHLNSILKSHTKYDLYTTPEGALEAGGNLSHVLPQSNISLQSSTVGDFKTNGNAVMVTSPLGEATTVSFSKENTTGTLYCSHRPAGTLTNMLTGSSVSICESILRPNSSGNYVDFSNAVNGIAFHNTFSIITEDRCLGYAFSNFTSSRGDKVFWKYIIKEPPCKHNH